MIDLERCDLCAKWRPAADICRAHHAAGSEWKMFKKRTRFKFIENHHRQKKASAAKHKQEQQHNKRNTFTLTAALTIAVICSHAQLTRASGGDGEHQPAATGAAAAEFLQSPDHFPSATLGRFGLIAGLRFESARANSSPVAAFLGVPYAAPPTGPLRFMPPGAVRPSAAANQNHRQQRRECQQLAPPPTTQQSSGISSGRSFGELGRECVRLADWSSPGGQRAARQNRQAEDCLNLNIFVPYEPAIRSDGKPRGSRATLEAETNHRNQNGQPMAADQETSATRRRSVVNSSEPNLIGGSISSSVRQDRETDAPSSPCYLEPLRVPGAWSSGDNKREKKWQSFNHYKQQNSKRRLPVIVVFHSAGGAGDANSLARHLSLAERAQSIVITFNYRFGLLGYLPYIDPEDQTGAGESSGAATAAHHTQTSRLNHALWDQIGLLFWIKQNVAAFLGDPANVTLLSDDNKAALQIQVLTLSPLAKGLFRRVVLTHHEDEPTSLRHDHLGHLFGLATRSRELRRKLVSEMGLIVRRMDEEEEEERQRGNATKTESGFSGDRRVFEFLKMANLSQLARVELELNKISVSKPGATTIKLTDLISEPNLDDKLLFPYFAQLVRVNQSLARAAHSDDEISSESGSFWSFLQENIDRVNADSRPLESTKVEVDYCLYLHHLRRGVFDRATSDNNMTTDELNQLDPYKLIPRLSEHQLMGLASGTALQRQSHSSTASDNNTSSLVDSNTMRWTRNRTANAIDFNHLRHAHLLQQLLVRKLESSAAAGNTSGLATLHQNMRRDNPSTETMITLEDHPTNTNLSHGEYNEDNEEEEDDNLLARQKQQQQQLQHEQSSARTKRSALDRLVILGQQSIELMANYDLLIWIDHDKSDLNQNEKQTSFGLIETLFRVNNYRQIDRQLLAYLHYASLHYISTIKMSPAYLDDLCDISSQYSSGSAEDSRHTPANETAWHDIVSSHVVLSHVEPRRTSIDHVTSRPTLPMDEDIKEFVHSGHLTSIKNQQIYSYDTLNYHLNIGPESDGITANETSEMTSIHLELVPYLKRMLSPHNLDSQPADLISCLGELESIITGTNNQSQSNYSMMLTRLNEESYCLTNVANKLRNQLRSGAAKELEPITRRCLSLSGDQHQLHRHMLTTKSTLKQQQLALINGLTTRNLVNQSDGLYLDQLSPADQFNNDQQMDASTSSNTSHSYLYDLNEASKHGVSVKAANSTGSSSLRGFFAKTYKDAVGQALGIVVGTGALIFLLNLIIVLIIALKSRRRIRSGNQHVQDSSSSGVINSVEQQQLKTLNGLLMAADHQVMMNGNLLPTASLDSGTVQTNQLTSSFRDQQPRSSLSSNSQRVNKSIKFDLSGVGDQTRLPAKNGAINQQQHQRGIMRQPIVTTSDEDGDLPPSDRHSMPSGTCVHHSRDNPYALHADRILSPLDMLDDSLDLNGFDVNEMLVSDEYSSSQPQQAQMPTNFTQVNQNKCAHHQRQMQSLGSGSLTSPFASQSTPSNSVASCGQQIYTMNRHNNSQGHHMIIADNVHQHQQQLFYPLAAAPALGHTAAILTSPSSSNTLSSAPTPIMLAGGANEPSAGSQQMVNLIYPCDNLLMQQLQSKTTNSTLAQGNHLLVHLSPNQQHYLLNSHQQQQ